MVPSGLTEKDLQRVVLKLARQKGWLAAHFGNSVKFVRRGTSTITIPDKDATGFPDCCFVRRERILFVELKGATGRVRPEQKVWLAALKEVPGVEVYLWKPVDWPTNIYNALA